MNAEKWQHSEIRIAINDESQGSRPIAKNLKCDELLYYTFIIYSAGERICKIGEHLAKLRAKSLTVIYSIRLAFLSSKMQMSPDKLNNLCSLLQTETAIKHFYVNRQINVS